MREKDLREALFKQGMIRCSSCGKHLKMKDCHFKDDPEHHRLMVKMRCTNPKCKTFGRDVEWYVPTDKFVIAPEGVKSPPSPGPGVVNP